VLPSSAARSKPRPSKHRFLTCFQFPLLALTRICTKKKIQLPKKKKKKKNKKNKQTKKKSKKNKKVKKKKEKISKKENNNKLKV
jgi:outer membrane biosynthesis protein TonB